MISGVVPVLATSNYLAKKSDVANVQKSPAHSSLSVSLAETSVLRSPEIPFN